MLVEHISGPGRTLFTLLVNNARWVIQQFREATGYGVEPRYIIRDDDRIYGSDVPAFLRNYGIKEVRTTYPVHGRIHIARELPEPYGMIYSTISSH